MLAVSLLLPLVVALGTQSNFSRRTETLRPQVLRQIVTESTTDGIEITLAQLHGRAAVPRGICEETMPDEERRHQEFDELTVEWKSSEPVTSIIVRLPEREECLGGVCTGYEFWSFEKERTCKLLKPRIEAGQKYDHQGVRLPTDPEKTSFDVSLETGLRCEVINNERADASVPQPHRSAMVELFKPSGDWDEPGMAEKWHHFTVLIRNPPVTPGGRDINHNSANTFQISLNSSRGLMAARSFEAREIQPAWVCGYSEWVKTTPCTAQCGGGQLVSTRRLLHAPPQGMDPRRKVCCGGALHREETCNAQVCDINCVLSDWTQWNGGACSRKCGGGELTERRFVITNAKGDGDICPHFSEKDVRVRTTPCNTQHCPVRCIEQEHIPDATGTSADADIHTSGEASESFLAIGMDAKMVERPRVEKGKAKGVCSKPCGGGKRKVVIPSAKKDIGTESRPEKVCHTEEEEDCNMFACKPLMFLPAQPWSHPVVGEWFLVDIVFVLEELTESLAIRAPPDFYLAASGDENECFFAEHTLPVLDSCTISPGQVESRTGPIMLFKFTHPLEPQNPLTTQRDYYHLRTWVQHPETCTDGSEGECRGKPGDRDWTLLVSSQQPHPLWEVTKGSYPYYKNVGFADKAFRAQQAKDLPGTPEAERVMPEYHVDLGPGKDGPIPDAFIQTDAEVKKEKGEKLDIVSLPGGKLQKVKKAKF